MYTTKHILAATLVLCTTFSSQSQVYKDPSADVDARVENLLSLMTLDEKIDYIGGINDFYIRSIPRLDVPQIKLTDGPVGTHKDGKSTAYPAGVLTASTWNRDLVYKLGEQLGRDSRARGVHILLGPGMNILRAPMCGRNYEYFTEDPYLNGQTAAQYVKGVQSQNVAATLKHFAANNQEWDRNNISSDIDMRTLHEIYLAGFKTAVCDAGASCIMDSYNPVNGVHATQNGYLNNTVLRDMWGFNGLVMSDWSATYDGVEAANGGLDLEMPRAKCMTRDVIKAAIADGRVDQKTIDDKVRHILRLIFSYGFFDNDQLDKSIPMDNPEGAAIALQLAREGIVLLKNENSLLPLNKDVKRVAVIGPNAAGYIAGGGSSYTFPFHSVSLLQGIDSLAGNNVDIVYTPGLPTLPETVAQSIFYTAAGSNERGLVGEYFPNTKLEGKPQFTRVDSIVSIANGYHIAAEHRGIPYDHCSMRWSGVIRPAKTADYRFAVRGFDGFRLNVDSTQVINEWRNQGITLKEVVLHLEAGREYPVVLEYFANVHPVDISFGWREDCLLIDEAAKLAARADVAIVSIGYNESLERESNDRPFQLPQYQDSLVAKVVEANPKTIVLVNAGSNADMSRWIDNVPSLLWLWYPGQEGGLAAAEILFGKTNPSGKLPVTFEKKWEDNPAYHYYYDTDGDMHTPYGEGLMVGYRHYDTNGVEPAFPFGHGLSYTTYEYSNLQVERIKTPNGAPAYNVTFDVTNTGHVDGMETAQVYVQPINPTVVRPYKELKGYDKMSIKAGETVRYQITLDSNAFSYFSPQANDFVYDEGQYRILVGPSSASTPLSCTISIPTE